MGEAFLVNPYDEERTASALERVLELPVEDRAGPHGRAVPAGAAQQRLPLGGPLPLHARGRHDRARDARRAPGGSSRRRGGGSLPGRVEPPAPARLRRHARSLRRRGRARRVPPARVLAVLGRLAGGRASRSPSSPAASRDDLERWFGGIARLWLVAEHGAAVRAAGHGLGARARRAAGRLEGQACCRCWSTSSIARRAASIEEKEFALVWHHRLSDPEFGEWLANELVATLDEMLADTELRAIRGHKTVEVRLVWANKGTVRRPPGSGAPRRGLPPGHGRRSHRRGPVRAACAIARGRYASGRAGRWRAIRCARRRR